MNTQTEKKIFIGIGAIGVLLIAVVFSFFMNISPEKISADLTNTNNFIGEASPIRIEKGYLLGGKSIYRNSEKRIALGLTSKNPVFTAQSIEVEMIEGQVIPETYEKTFENKRFILQEKIQEENVQKVLENFGGNNWAAVYLDLLIPDYSYSEMPEGEYTLVATLHRNEDFQSQVFLPVSLYDFPQKCDINGDGYENMIDLILSLKIMNGSIIPSQNEKKKLDFNHNGMIELTDTIKMFKCILNPEDESSYFDKTCENAENQIDKLLCPTGSDIYIRNIEPIDTDNDGIFDTEDPDDDNDGLTDTEESILGTSPLFIDTDNDGLNDNIEVEMKTDPLKNDTDDDGILDKEEIDLGLNPLSPDSDNDGTNDKEEIEKNGHSIATPSDTDGDGVIDALESSTTPADNPDETNPENDSDNDGVSNKAEFDAIPKTNPLDKNSYPGGTQPATDCDDPDIDPIFQLANC